MGTINNQILNFADKLIPISDFSKGKLHRYLKT